MYEQQAVGVVVPAYNEERHVGTVIETMPAFVDRIYAVDDHSTDRTWDVIRAAAGRPPERVVEPADLQARVGNGPGGVEPSSDPPSPTASGATGRPGAEPGESDRAVADGDGRVVPLRHTQNRGAGAAVVTGYRRAVADGMDVIAVMDGDGQMDPAVLDRIVAPVAEGRAGYAKGDRLSDSRLRAEMSAWRTFGNALLTLLTRASTGYWRLTDPQNGYTAIDARVATRLPLDELYDRYGFLNDLLARLSERGVTVVDVPHEAVYGSEESGISYRSFVPRLSGLLARNFLRRIVRRHVVGEFHPLAGCYAAGGVGLLATLPLVLAAAAGVTRPATAVVAAFLSVFLLVQAVVFDYRTNATLSKTADRPPASVAGNSSSPGP